MPRKRYTNLKPLRGSKLFFLPEVEEFNPSFECECGSHLTDLERFAKPLANVKVKSIPNFYVNDRFVDHAPPERKAPKPAPGKQTKLRRPYSDSFAEPIQITLPRLRCLEAA